MPDSIQEQIIKKIEAALSQITVANGYQNTINSVQRDRWAGINLGHMPTILIREGDCLPELTKSSHERVRRRMELLLVAAVPPDTDTDPISGGEILNSFMADIEKCLGANQRWDGLAIMTEPPSYLEVDIEAETPHLSRGIRTEIVYEHLRADPWAQ